MEATGGNYGARIVNGTGALGSARFEITGGTAELRNDGSTWFSASNWECHGTHYGSSGQAIGGAWGLYDTSDEGAWGIFQATKP